MKAASEAATRRSRPRDMLNHVFYGIVEIAYREAGLRIPSSKQALVQSRISRRLRDLGLDDFEDYLAIVSADAGREERRRMVSALTTNVSSFFREKHHFETLRAIGERLVRKAKTGGRVRLWSAGCSSGQEPYSMAMTLLDVGGPDLSRLDVKILASDIDSEILRVARRGAYTAEMMTGVSDVHRSRYFAADAGRGYVVGKNVRSLVSFRELNLLGTWPLRGTFDVIFCRNVVIYFDEETQVSLWPRFRAALADTGYLFLGHSERIIDPSAVGFCPTDVTTYQADTRHSRQNAALPR